MLHRFVVISCLGCIRRYHRDKSLYTHISRMHIIVGNVYMYKCVDVRVEPLLILVQRTHTDTHTFERVVGIWKTHFHHNSALMCVCVFVCSDRNRQPSAVNWIHKVAMHEKQGKTEIRNKLQCERSVATTKRRKKATTTTTTTTKTTTQLNRITTNENVSSWAGYTVNSTRQQ